MGSYLVADVLAAVKCSWACCASPHQGRTSQSPSSTTMRRTAARMWRSTATERSDGCSRQHSKGDDDVRLDEQTWAPPTPGKSNPSMIITAHPATPVASDCLSGPRGGCQSWSDWLGFRPTSSAVWAGESLFARQARTEGPASFADGRCVLHSGFQEIGRLGAHHGLHPDNASRPPMTVATGGSPPSDSVLGHRRPKHVLPRRRSRSWLGQRLLDGFLGSDQRRGGGRVVVVR